MSRFVFTSEDLTDYFRPPEYRPPTAAQQTEVSSFFNRIQPKFEFSCARYLDFPDNKVARMEKEQQERLLLVEPYKWTEYHQNLSKSRLLFGVKPSLIKQLPEVLLVGHTNAGKLSLINNLLLSQHQAKARKAETTYARVSKRPGYTKLLNVFNLGNKLRLVDSPGYGQGGRFHQGNLVLEYIRRRKQLRRVFVVIDSVEGINEHDVRMIDHLVENGVPFEIVFTKMDELFRKKFPVFNHHPPKKDVKERLRAYNLVKNGNSGMITYFQRMFEETNLDNLATLPKLIFNNALVSKSMRRRHGYKELRFAILESCGLLQTPGESVQPVITPEENRGRRKSVARSPRAKST